MKIRTERDLQQLIDNSVTESLHLEFKAADALGPKKKIDISIDVSAFANAEGGTIIYGIKEDRSKHCAEKIDPINKNEFSQEWIEQIIFDSISPKLRSFEITPIQINGSVDQVVYVVEILQSETAHQAKDHRYHRRLNFQNRPMEDYEVKDILNRIKTPKIELEFMKCIFTTPRTPEQRLAGIKEKTNILVKVTAKNSGAILARFVHCTLGMPADQTTAPHVNSAIETWDGVEYKIFLLANASDDHSKYIPILPGMPMRLGYIRLDNYPTGKMYWRVNADNAPPKEGWIDFNNIGVSDKR